MASEQAKRISQQLNPSDWGEGGSDSCAASSQLRSRNAGQMYRVPKAEVTTYGRGWPFGWFGTAGRVKPETTPKTNGLRLCLSWPLREADTPAPHGVGASDIRESDCYASKLSENVEVGANSIGTSDGRKAWKPP